jgi:Fe-S cluster assembly protein SufD
MSPPAASPLVAPPEKSDKFHLVNPDLWPEWFLDAQRAAEADFAGAPVPSRKDEAWRFSDLGAADIGEFLPAEPVASEGRIINLSAGIGKTSARMVFGNNALLHREESALPPGVVITTLEAAACEHPGLFRTHFMAQPVELGSHRMAALHRARLSTGAFIHVPDNTRVDLPVEIFHWVEGDRAAVFPHTLVICGKNSSLSLVDHFRSADGHRAFACGVNDLHLGEGARLEYIADQQWADSSTAFHINSTIVAAGATATALAANFGAGYLRGESLSRLNGEGARSEMFALNPMDGRRQIDQRTLQDHAAPAASSDLLYLNTLGGASRSIFAGLIKVRPGAHRTDAYQKVRNLVLSDDAEANSMPGLEILADDVRCTHGATSGQIDEEELFYLQARGIPKDTGRRLIVNGFFQTLLGRMEPSAARDYISGLVSSRLGIAGSVA